ncbi:hypothetical protein FACS189472_00120 [Alphaproteobacteria bacterium]|nr:hypothetical protein FACS189472_00120 [Alphaproteobacteria bacterium]
MKRILLTGLFVMSVMAENCFGMTPAQKAGLTDQFLAETRQFRFEPVTKKKRLSILQTYLETTPVTVDVALNAKQRTALTKQFLEERHVGSIQDLTFEQQIDLVCLLSKPVPKTRKVTHVNQLPEDNQIELAKKISMAEQKETTKFAASVDHLTGPQLDELHAFLAASHDPDHHANNAGPSTAVDGAHASTSAREPDCHAGVTGAASTRAPNPSAPYAMSSDPSDHVPPQSPAQGARSRTSKQVAATGNRDHNPYAALATDAAPDTQNSAASTERPENDDNQPRPSRTTAKQRSQAKKDRASAMAKQEADASRNNKPAVPKLRPSPEAAKSETPAPSAVTQAKGKANKAGRPNSPSAKTKNKRKRTSPKPAAAKNNQRNGRYANHQPESTPRPGNSVRPKGRRHR